MPARHGARAEAVCDTGDGVVKIRERLVVKAVRDVPLERRDELVAQRDIRHNRRGPHQPVRLGVRVPRVERDAVFV